MTRRQSFFNETKLSKIWNKIIKFEDHLLATVMWHDKPWKIVLDNDFDTIKQPGYKPFAEFRTQQELWEYLKTN